MIGRMNCNAVDVCRLREAVDYDPETGAMVWRVRPAAHFPNRARMARWNGKYAGRPAMTSIDPRGYRLGGMDGKNLWAHRVAWALHFGAWPDFIIDHKNRDKGDNRIRNLRIATHTQNALNAKQSDRPERCVYPAQRSDGWRAVVKRGGKVIFHRTFRTREEAENARDEVERLWDQRSAGGRYAKDDMPGVLVGQKEETRPVPVGDVQVGRGGVAMLALPVQRGVLL